VPDQSKCVQGSNILGIYQGESVGGGGSNRGIFASTGGGDDVVDPDYHPCPGKSNASVKRMKLKGVRGREVGRLDCVVTWCVGLKQRHSPHAFCRSQGVTDYIVGVIVIIVGSSLQSLGLTVLKVCAVHPSCYTPLHCNVPPPPAVGSRERSCRSSRDSYHRSMHEYARPCQSHCCCRCVRVRGRV
jgi:hypothetical protein